MEQSTTGFYAHRTSTIPMTPASENIYI